MEDRPYSLEVEALDLGPETQAVGLELLEAQSANAMSFARRASSQMAG